MANTVKIPPIKSQGIKTKLVPWIKSVVPDSFNGTWVEPFMGTGVVAFNIPSKHAILCDTNPHLINFYSAIASGHIDAIRIASFLKDEGRMLMERGEVHYYEVRERFNSQKDPLDFLFLNRAGFNGMIRFNGQGKFNVPFCRKPQRFAQAYVTKIVNQVDHISRLLKTKTFTFKRQGFEETIANATSGDIIYCDPPYIDRHADYYNGWGSVNEGRLFELLLKTKAHFILSTWHHNDYRKNEYIETLWNRFHVMTREHFYHVGARETNRNPMVEALITNFTPKGMPQTTEIDCAQKLLLGFDERQKIAAR